MHLKYKMMFHVQDGQHSNGLVMCLMVSRNAILHFETHETFYILNAYFILVLRFNFYI
jgi:hypothetical protein